MWYFILLHYLAVGKSCLVLQFIDKRFKMAHDITIGVEFGVKILPVNDKKIKLQIWDTAGTEAFRSITKGYYKGSVGALLVYDVTHKASFEHAQTWIEDLRQNTNKKTTICLVGNKCDLAEQYIKIRYF